MDAGVQFDTVMLMVVTEERPATPSNVAAVLAGPLIRLPLPEQVPEMVKFLLMPLAAQVLEADCSGNESVETAGPELLLEAESLPPPPPQAASEAATTAVSMGLYIRLQFTF
jgi:hypothetical protein